MTKSFELKRLKTQRVFNRPKIRIGSFSVEICLFREYKNWQ